MSLNPPSSPIQYPAPAPPALVINTVVLVFKPPHTGNSLDYKHQGFFHNTILGINKTEALGNCSPTSSTAYNYADHNKHFWLAIWWFVGIHTLCIENTTKNVKHKLQGRKKAQEVRSYGCCYFGSMPESLQMMDSMISSAPAPMESSRMSLYIRLTSTSSVYPIPPQY